LSILKIFSQRCTPCRTTQHPCHSSNTPCRARSDP
jgi:hypothetical protein